jgi:hypothetical protein
MATTIHFKNNNEATYENITGTARLPVKVMATGTVFCDSGTL